MGHPNEHTNEHMNEHTNALMHAKFNIDENEDLRLHEDFISYSDLESYITEPSILQEKTCDLFIFNV